jgi:antitoxin ParD1/3/4
MAVSAELGPKLEKYVAKLVKSGRYNSKSEVIREGVRLLQEKEFAQIAQLKQLIQAGLDDVTAGRVSPVEESRRRVVARVRAAVKRAKLKRAA